MLKKYVRWLGVVSLCVSMCLVSLEAVSNPGPSPVAGVPTVVASVQAELDIIRKKYGIASVSLSVMKDGKVAVSVAVGESDKGVKASPETIYLTASCSKPVVGLAVAKLMDLNPSFDLDADINTYLKWSPPLEHPDFPGQKITMRQLMLHKSGLGRDAPFEYEDYPKPDPNQALDAFLQAQIMGEDADEEAWLESAPGEAEEYSNLGAALAALVVEKVSGKDFAAFCEEHLFKPLALTDTHWRFKEFSKDQQARIALPFDADGNPYEQFGFNDYPSGLLRTTTKDFALLWATIATGGAKILSPDSLKRFEDIPMFIGHDSGAFSHDGSEHGTNTYFVYRKDGSGYVVFINSDLEDDALEQFFADVDALVRKHARSL